VFFVIIFVLSGYSVTSDDSEIVSFVYHRFGDNRYASTNTSLDDFESHLRYLKENKIPVKNLSQAMDDMTGNTTRSVVLTIDDGFMSFYQNGYPLLKKYGFTATLFVNTGSVGNSDYMGWGQIREVMEYGIEIGNHSTDHDQFLEYKIPDRLEKFRSSVGNASRSFHDELGFVPDIFAYPYGEYTLELKSHLEQKSFRYAMAQNSGVIDLQTDPFRLPRFSMSGRFGSLKRFIEKVSMKSLRVNEKPESQVFENNPPVLILQIIDNRVDLSSIQCFIQGSASCKISKVSDDPFTIRIVNQGELRNRRTLYTITARSKTGNKWHWYSKIWVNTKVKE